jgi:hypothetical protein
VDSLLASDTTKYPPFFSSMLVACRGWRTVLAGDTVAGLKDMARGLEDAAPVGGSFLTGPVRLQYAAILASRPDSRQQGIRLLRHGFDTDIGFLPMTVMALARAYEAVGDKANAAEAYGRLIRLWNKADESGKARVDEAKAALERLTGEAPR